MKTRTSRASSADELPHKSVADATRKPPAHGSTRSRQPASRPDVSHFDQLPDAALIAIKALAAVLGKGVSSAWRDIKNDPDFPKPIRLSAGCTRFRVGDIRAYMAKKTAATAQPKRTRAGKAG